MGFIEHIRLLLDFVEEYVKSYELRIESYDSDFKGESSIYLQREKKTTTVLVTQELLHICCFV